STPAPAALSYRSARRGRCCASPASAAVNRGEGPPCGRSEMPSRCCPFHSLQGSVSTVDRFAVPFAAAIRSCTGNRKVSVRSYCRFPELLRPPRLNPLLLDEKGTSHVLED